jgi:hypothetical protein
MKKMQTAITSKAAVCPICGATRSNHANMLNHVVGYHADVAQACIPFRCDSCNTAFKSEKAQRKHHAGSCKRPSADIAERDGKSSKLQRVDNNTQCCGYSFGGRVWNLERHKRTRHGIGTARCVVRCQFVLL